MDDAARLVSELHDKLTELDGKVAAYQRDMLAEFHRHMDECLEKYPDHVSQQVSRAIAESMSTGKYPALSPPAREVPDSPAIDRNAWDGRNSPPPILRHTSGTPKEGPRGPHAREREFQGLFTPTYLPLLESNDRAYSSPPVSPPPTLSGGSSFSLTIDNVKKAEEPGQAVLASRESRPTAVRRSTDQSTSSISSSDSDSKVRRSALRRSSSSAKSSPRRVRFEFEGEEVFPASSLPQAPTVVFLEESGAEPQPEAETSSAVATEDESTAYGGTSLLDVEGEEDFLPRPKKVSSTQALQALTRSPLEEGSTWTVVNANTEEPAKMNGDKQPKTTQDLLGKVDSQATIQSDGMEEEPGDGQLGTPIEEQTVYNEHDNASDEEFLSMKPKGKSPSPVASMPFARPAQSPAATARTTAMQHNGINDLADGDLDEDEDDDDDDPFFDLDDESGLSKSQKETQKYLPDPESDDEDATPGRLRKAAREQAGESSAKVPPVSPSAALFGHSIGSYMGRSMTINPIKDPKLYDEIANMKDVHFTVGSLHDVTEAEAAKMGSYRASSVARYIGGAPRSFTERLALEEEMERRAAAGEDEDY